MQTIKRFKQHKCVAKWSNNNTRKLFVRELQEFDNDKICLLLYDTDAEAPGASFADLDTDEQRDENKKEREGRPQSAHLVVKLTGENEPASRYLAILEESTRLTRRHVQWYLNAILKDAVKYSQQEFCVPHIDGSKLRDGTPKMQNFYPKFDLQGHISHSFRKDLETGKLRGITLESTKGDRLAFAESGSVQFRRSDIKLRPVGPWYKEPFAKIKDALNLGRAHRYETARIVFQTLDGTSHVAMLDTETENLVTDGYIKRIRLDGFDHPISEANTTIDTQLRDKMGMLI
jgi:hypothetical protein